MPDKSATDPLAAWREIVSQWEKGVNSLANQNMATDQFSGSMNQMMKVMMQAQQSVSDGMVKYLATLNLPSRADLIALGEQLGSIESQLSRIAQILERQAAVSAATASSSTSSAGSAPTNVPKAPPRTKRPPTSAA
jgi:hypothetical protein